VKRAPDLKALMTKSPPLTLAVAESLTSGQVQIRVGAISGASTFFLGGITAYSLDQKVKHLGVRRAAARRVNSVAAHVAGEMACGVCELFGSALGVATTGYAEPSPMDGVGDPFAWWAIAHRRRGRLVVVRSGRVECPGGTRIDVQRIVAEAVLAELIDYVETWRTVVNRKPETGNRKRRTDRGTGRKKAQKAQKE
jgi:nicotinamide-nucleotide amidase